MECAPAAEAAEKGDVLEIDFETGIIKNITKNEEYQSAAFPEFIQRIIAAGGLLNSLK